MKMNVKMNIMKNKKMNTKMKMNIKIKEKVLLTFLEILEIIIYYTKEVK